MSNLDNFCNVAISLNGPGLAAESFGSCLLLAYHTKPSAIMGPYATTTDVAADFPVGSAVYRMATTVFSQQPKPDSVFVGKRANVHTMAIKMTPVNLTTGFVYSFALLLPDGVTTVNATYTVIAMDTADEIVDGLMASLGSPSGVTLTDGVTYLTLSATTPGAVFDLTGLPLPGDMTIENTTTDPGIVADITAVYVADPASWYGVALDVGGALTETALAVWIEANEKVFAITTSDSAVVDSGSTTDIAYTQKGLSHIRTGVTYVANQVGSYAGLGLLAAKLATTPAGGVPFFYATIAGVAPDKLLTAQVSAATGVPKDGSKGKNATIYVSIAGSSRTLGGRVALGEWWDVVFGRDVLKARIQESVLGLQMAAATAGTKVPFTDSGITQIQGAIQAPLLAAEQTFNGASFLTPGSSSVVVPKAKNVSPTDKQNRVLSGVTFSAQIAGAIYATKMTGNLTA